MTTLTPIVTSTKPSAIDKIILFTGILFVLLGIYSSFKVGLNFWIYPNKYPTGGIFSGGYYGQREEDCYFSVAGPYFDAKGMTRPVTPEEKQLAADNQARCLSGVMETRKAAKVNDLSSIGFFLLIGLGILASKKWLIK
jgi:hypothetical protein